MEKFISARKGVKSAHDFFSEFFPYHMPYFGVYFLEWKVRATKERANRSVAEVCESFNLIIAHFGPPSRLCQNGAAAVGHWSPFHQNLVMGGWRGRVALL